MLKKFIFLFFAVIIVSGCNFVNAGNGNIKGDEENSNPDEYAETDEFADPDESADTDELTDFDENITPDEDNAPDRIVVGTYNTFMFFDTVCDSGNCDTYDFEKQFSTTEYNKKVKDVAAALTLINADIVLLQEIEKKVCLDDLFDEMNGVYNDSYIGETGYDASIDTAVITKGTITYTNKHTGSIPHPDGGTTYFTRAFLEAHINIGGRKIIVFSAHFKSKSNDDPKRRQAEADEALKIINSTASKYPGALIVMGGDLNDTPGSGPISTLENSSGLLRVAAELSATDQATYDYSGPIAIDHIFHSLYGSWSYVEGSAKVIKDSPSWYSLISSDHAALRAEFEY